MLFMRTTEQFRIAYTAKTDDRCGPILAHAVRFVYRQYTKSEYVRNTYI